MNVYTSAQIREVLGIKPGTLRIWVLRGHVVKVGRDLYDGDSVIARWQQMAARTDGDRATEEV